MVLAVVSVIRSKRERAELEATASERNPRIQVNGSSSSAPTFSSHLPLSTAKMYAQVVPELASLLDHMERKDPILVISATDASTDPVLPFQLPTEYGCVVLGFFDVESVEVGNMLPSLFRYFCVSEISLGSV